MRKSLRLFLWLFAGLLIFEFLLYGIGSASDCHNPFVVFPIVPAIWIGMAIGGVHTMGLSSFLIGLCATSFFYAAVAWVCVAAFLKIRNKTRKGRPGPFAGQ